MELSLGGVFFHEGGELEKGVFLEGVQLRDAQTFHVDTLGGRRPRPSKAVPFLLGATDRHAVKCNIAMRA